MCFSDNNSNKITNPSETWLGAETLFYIKTRKRNMKKYDPTACSVLKSIEIPFLSITLRFKLKITFLCAFVLCLWCVSVYWCSWSGRLSIVLYKGICYWIACLLPEKTPGTGRSGILQIRLMPWKNSVIVVRKFITVQRLVLGFSGTLTHFYIRWI